MTREATPAASVVIPTRGRPAYLVDCIETLLAQEGARPFEVLVVDDGPDDERTREAVEGVAARPPVTALRYLRQKRAGLNAARNRGIEAAAGELLCFLDDDVLLPPDWLAQLQAGAARHPDAHCLGGPILLRLEGDPPRMCGGESISEGEFDLGPEEQETTAVYGGNMAIRRRALELAGPFDEALPLYHEEAEWEVRLLARGGRIVYLPGPWVWHRRAAADLRLGRMLRRRFRYGYGAAAFARATGERPFPLAPLARVPRLLAHLVRRRCWWGALGAAYQLGLAYGLLRRRPA